MHRLTTRSTPANKGRTTTAMLQDSSQIPSTMQKYRSTSNLVPSPTDLIPSAKVLTHQRDITHAMITRWGIVVYTAEEGKEAEGITEEVTPSEKRSPPTIEVRVP